MRSRTSSSDLLRVWRKDLSRFAPVWIVWSVMYLVGIYLCYEMDADLTAAKSQFFATFLPTFTVASCLYGFGCAVSLFGYLCDKRECNAVHAFPIRREEYFLVHLAAGLTMSLVPGLVFCLAIAPLCLNSPLLLFIGIQLQFVFFFGLGIFCMFLVGRKMAAALIYGLLNALAAVVKLMADILYLPMLPGVQVDSQSFYRFSPVYAMMINNEEEQLWRFGSDYEQYLPLLGMFALIGVGLMVLSLLLYRRRKLEYAGDFLAVKALQPAFIGMVSLVFGFAGAVMAELTINFESLQANRYILVYTGFAVGYFGALMLIKRTAKVFSLKSLGGLAVVLALAFVSMWGTKADIFGRVMYVPEADEVERVELRYHDYSTTCYQTSDPEVIGDLTQMHAAILENEDFDNPYISYESAFFTYYLTDGTRISRQYWVAGEAQLQRLDFYYSQPENQLGVSTAEDWLERTKYVDLRVQNDFWTLEGEARQELYAIVFEDMRAGRMHVSGENAYLGENSAYSENIALEMEIYTDTGVSYEYLTIPATAEASQAWVKEYTAENGYSFSYGE